MRAPSQESTTLPKWTSSAFTCASTSCARFCFVASAAIAEKVRAVAPDLQVVVFDTEWRALLARGGRDCRALTPRRGRPAGHRPTPETRASTAASLPILAWI